MKIRTLKAHKEEIEHQQENDEMKITQQSEVEEQQSELNKQQSKVDEPQLEAQTKIQSEIKLEKQTSFSTFETVKILQSSDNLAEQIQAITKKSLAGRIRCPYKDVDRFINAHVCKWHRDEKDPECFKANCKRVGGSGKSNKNIIDQNIIDQNIIAQQTLLTKKLTKKSIKQSYNQEMF